MFNNIISHAIYAKNILQVIQINKVSNGQQLFLYTDWHKGVDREIITQKMCLLSENYTTG